MTPAHKRPVRIANCSGAAGDPGDYMFNQAAAGQVDFITGDYLAEVNLAWMAEPYSQGKHPGFVPTALDGLTKSLDLINERKIKVVINGGGLNPKGLAKQVQELSTAKGYTLKVAYVSGDDLLEKIPDLLSSNALKHIDSENGAIKLSDESTAFLTQGHRETVSANAYLGARGIRVALDQGADIVICGRVADASPVIAAAQYWHGWSDGDYDELAGSLLAGHLIECSTYVTGGNFAGFDRYEIQDLVDIACPIAEIDATGACVITRHESLRGFVTEDTVRCQLVYELQGSMYLNSDVKADLTHVRVSEEAANRVRVWGAKGHPPPPTTKLATYYKGAYQGEFTINATGLHRARKFELQEAQLRARLKEWGVLPRLQILDFQSAGESAENPRSQLAATAYLRIFVQAQDKADVTLVHRAWATTAMQHFPGMHGSLEFRAMMDPKSVLFYFPALVDQGLVTQYVHELGSNGEVNNVITVPGAPPKSEPLGERDSFDPPSDSYDFSGETVTLPLGNLALARSGDKGSNVNIGFFPRDDAAWPWLRAFLTRDRMKKLMGDDWDEATMFVERVEFPNIRAVHFVVYGTLGNGVSSSSRVDCLGKGFAEFITAVHVPVPVALAPCS